MKKFLMLSCTSLSLHVTAGEIEDSVNKYLEQGYVLAGNLIHVIEGSVETAEWQTLIQPMILKEKTHEIIEH